MSLWISCSAGPREMPRARLARARSQRFERFVEQKKLFMAFRRSKLQMGLSVTKSSLKRQALFLLPVMREF